MKKLVIVLFFLILIISLTTAVTDTFKIEKTSTKFKVGNGVKDIISVSLGDDHLPNLLSDGEFRGYDNVDYDYIQKIELENHSLNYFSDGDYNGGVEALGFRIVSGSPVLSYSLDLSDEPTEENFYHKPIYIFGKTYFILSSDFTSKIIILEDINGNQIKLEDNNNLKYNDDFVSDLEVNLQFNSGKITLINIDWIADEDLFITEANSLTMPALNMITWRFEGLSDFYGETIANIYIDANSVAETTLECTQDSHCMERYSEKEHCDNCVCVEMGCDLEPIVAYFYFSDTIECKLLTVDGCIGESMYGSPYNTLEDCLAANNICTSFLPPPGWCYGGVVNYDTGVDSKGCPNDPVCIRNNNSNQNNTIDCTDSDGGKNYYIKGTTTPKKSSPTDTVYANSDYCITTNTVGKQYPENTLIEYYCSVKGIVKLENFTCENGCFDGACISSNNQNKICCQKVTAEFMDDSSKKYELVDEKFCKDFGVWSATIVDDSYCQKFRYSFNSSECPQNCSCTGAVKKCALENNREMIVSAGRSGNIIVIVNGVEMNTSVTLYKGSDGNYYYSFNGEQKKLGFFPDQIKEKVRKRLSVRLHEEFAIDLIEGEYRIETKKYSRLFAIFPVKKRVNIIADPEIGEILDINEPWWSFLAKDELIDYTNFTE